MLLQPEVLYLAILMIFLVMVRSPWPWTRLGGAALLLSSLAGLVLWRPSAALFTEPRTLTVCLLAGLTGVVVWWSLHDARYPPNRGPTVGSAVGPTGGRPARLVAVAAGVALVAALAVLLGAPKLSPFPAQVEAPTGPWFLAGLWALAPLVGGTFAFGLIPTVALCGLLLAPNLDAHDADAQAPFSGRRDDVPFFLFAWLAVGVVPIVLAVLRPEFGSAPSPSFAERFWLDGLGTSLPAAWWLRELPGVALYLSIFVLLPRWLPVWRATKGVFGRHQRRLGRARYALLMTLTGLLMLVPLKVALHAFFSIGPWLVLPGGISL